MYCTEVAACVLLSSFVRFPLLLWFFYLAFSYCIFPSFFLYFLFSSYFPPFPLFNPTFISSALHIPRFSGLASCPQSSPSRCLSDLRAGRLLLVAFAREKSSMVRLAHLIQPVVSSGSSTAHNHNINRRHSPAHQTPVPRNSPSASRSSTVSCKNKVVSDLKRQQRRAHQTFVPSCPKLSRQAVSFPPLHLLRERKMEAFLLHILVPLIMHQKTSRLTPMMLGTLLCRLSLVHPSVSWILCVLFVPFVLFSVPLLSLLSFSATFFLSSAPLILFGSHFFYICPSYLWIVRGPHFCFNIFIYLTCLFPFACRLHPNINSQPTSPF